MNDDNTIVTELTVSLDNPNKLRSEPPSMEGFVIPADFLVSMAEQCDLHNANVTVSFEKCGKLGGKTVILTVKGDDPKEAEKVLD